MTIATSLGTAIANTAAYTKHAVVASGVAGNKFVRDTAAATREQYAIKDAELAAKREALRANAALIAAPKSTRQRKLATQ